MPRLRIDADLYPAEPPLSSELLAAQRSFSDGMFDCSLYADEAARRLVRAVELETVLFNEVLNRAVAAYGVHIVNVPRTTYQYAVAYGSGRPSPDILLRRALDLRDNILPAVVATYRPDVAATRSVLGEMFDDTLRCAAV